MCGRGGKEARLDRGKSRDKCSFSSGRSHCHWELWRGKGPLDVAHITVRKPRLYILRSARHWMQATSEEVTLEQAVQWASTACYFLSLHCMLFPEEDDNWGILAIRGTSSPYGTGIWTTHHSIHYWSPFFFLNHEASIHPFKQPHKGDVPQLRRKGKVARLKKVNILHSSLQYSLVLHIGTHSLAEFCFISVLYLKAELLK